jgi:hypothetical protein
MSGPKLFFIYGLLSVIKYDMYRMVLTINVDAFLFTQLCIVEHSSEMLRRSIARHRHEGN